jgi:hypothetical protein
MAEQMSHAEFSRRGGSSKSESKLKSSLNNLARAQAVRLARRAAQNVSKTQSA